MITHTSLDAFEQRAREGKVRTLVDADLHMIVSLINVARVSRAFLDTHTALAVEAELPGGVSMEEVGRRLAVARMNLTGALASVPR